MGRVHFNGKWYLLVKREKTPLAQDQIFFITEDRLDEAAKIFLNQYIPTNDIAVYTQSTPEMDKFQKDLDELVQEKLEIQDELKTLKNKMRGASDDGNEESSAFAELKAEYDECLEENYELKSQTTQLNIELNRLSKRVEELNQMKVVSQKLLEKGKTIQLDESLPNWNEEQISYGKSLKSLLGEAGKRGSNLTKSDPDLSRDNRDSSGNDSDEKTTLAGIIEHVKGTLNMYLRKTPTVDKNNEQLLTIMYSMLKFTAVEINDINMARAMLPVYKVDEKLTKKAQKTGKANLSAQGSVGGAMSSGAYPGAANMTEPNDQYQDTGDSFGHNAYLNAPS